MAKLTKMYLKFPIPLQQAACSIEGWRIHHSRYGGEFSTLLHEAESRTFWSEARMCTYRDERLQKFVKHCFETVPYYNRIFQEWGVLPDDVCTLDDLACLPILTKQDVKNHYSELISSAVPENQRVSFHTSGTTGSGLHFSTTQRSLQEQWAVVWRFRRWHGIQLDTWCGYFAGRHIVPLVQQRPPFWRYNFPGRQILFSGAHMSPDNLGAYVNELRKRQPPYLQGYPSLLSLLAAYMVESKDCLDYQVKWVVANSENFLPHQVDIIEKAFGVRPIQRYGAGEAVVGASECEYGRLHMDEDIAATEIIPNPTGFGHKVIGTAFTNLAIPLLRYEVGDIVTLSDERCLCGRPGRILQTIDGRKDDYIVLKNGARLGGWIDIIFKDMVNIHEAQIYQRKVGEIIIRVVPSANFTRDDEVRLLELAKNRTGLGADISIEYVERIERSRNGKLRCVVSDIDEGRLESAF